MLARLGSGASTALVLLGASDFTRAGLPGGPSFAESAKGIRAYFSYDYGLDDTCILDLFDASYDPTETVTAIAEFLSTQWLSSSVAEQDRYIILYYVGHGGFVGSPEFFALFLRSSNSRRRAASTLNGQLLAEAFGDTGRIAGKILILDCCFSGALSTIPLQSDRQQIIERRAASRFLEAPLGGAAVLAAASAADVTFAPSALPRTLFTEA